MAKQQSKAAKKEQTPQIKQLQKENDRLKKERTILQKEIDRLQIENSELEKEKDELKDQLISLQEKLNKDSHNSSKPPSTDGFKKKTKSLRKPSGKKPGGQPGHKGHTLKMIENPDDVIQHKVNECEGCGYSFDSHEVDIYNVESHQVFDIAELKLKVTEHQAEMKRCPRCGRMNKAQFPTQASNIVQYGERINGLASYLSNYQLIPQDRVREFFLDLFNHPLTKASLISMNRKAYKALQSFDDAIKEKLIHSSVLHVDESGFRCENKRQWLHCASTELMTYYQFHQKRGKEAMDEIGILPYFKGTLIHDFWTPYLKYLCTHGLCNAHHLRELVFLIEEKKCDWASDMKSLLLEIKETVDAKKTESNTNTNTNTNRKSLALEADIVKKFEKRYDEIIEKAIEAEIKRQPPKSQSDKKKKRGRQKKSKALNLLLRLRDHKEKALAFMYNFEVPFDNNQGERDIRMIKLQQKISGTFRTNQGAKSFCRIRGYISTARKNGINACDAINDAIRGQPFIPIT